ncbi:50S ribosomal protein L3 chloroplastic [Bienertia sinuspersici]
MAAVSPSLSIKSSSCTYSRSTQTLHYQKTVSSSCSIKGTPNIQPLRLSSSFLSSPNQINKLKSAIPRAIQLNRSIGGLEIKMISVEAGVGVMGTKLGMMSLFQDDGTVVPVTVIGFKEGNIVTQVKTESTDGYNAVQVGYERVRDRKLTKPELGHLSKSEVIPLRHLQEFRLVSVDDFTPSQKILFEDLFNEGDLVDISGTTIGKGFQGGIKRHNFKRGLMTHGSKSHRQLGSIGAGTTPGHVYKGKKMPGRMGGTKTKIRKLKIMKVDTDLRVVMVKGAVPGKPGNLLRLAPAKIVGKNIPKN